MEHLNPQERNEATVIRRAALADGLTLHGHYDVVCLGPDGREKWRDTIENVVTTGGKNLLLTKFLTGASYTAAVYMGLKGTGTAVAGDTQASHSAWNEVGGTNAPAYTGNRQTPSFAAASGGSIATSAAVSFAITSSGTVAGAFINEGGSATKDDTTATLFSAGDFTGGSKTVSSGDTVNVTYTLSV